ncbi:MAG: hypothetical protein GX492_01100 [Firmicutes bacterium]|nr:hypothetical protein [Bacillota bacterium]
MSESEFTREARMAMAAKLHEMDRTSAGLAAELAGLDRLSFLLAQVLLARLMRSGLDR